MIKGGYVYILASKKNGTIYIGVTQNLHLRIYQHRQGLADGFTKKYNVTALVYFEEYQTIEEAIGREKQLKHWNRKWKLMLIEDRNPQWNDLYDIYFPGSSLSRG